MPEITSAGPCATDQDVATLFGQLANNDAAATRRDIVRAVAEQLGLSPKTVYAALERAKTADGGNELPG
jgi:hypothetical protein